MHLEQRTRIGGADLGFLRDLRGLASSNAVARRTTRVSQRVKPRRRVRKEAAANEAAL